MIAMLINHVAEKTNVSAIYSVAFSPDGTKIVSGLYDKTIKVWDSGAPEFSTSNLLGQN
jgi:WD40 repeat protein